MFKKEIIWREILFQAIKKNKYDFQQKKLAGKFSFSLSTVFNALKKPRDIKAIEVSGRGFRLINVEKLLYLWATERNIEKDIIYSAFIPETPSRIEGGMPDGIIWGLFSAYRQKFHSVPSDYDKVYIYANRQQLLKIKKRFPQKKGPKNLFVLQVDNFLKNYGTSGTLSQIFVDIWNTSDWYAQEFLKKLKIKMNI